MTITETLDNLRDWFDENLCQKIKLKVPNDNSITGEATLVNPAAFALYVPAKDRIPPNVAAPIPSICVQLMEGEDMALEKKRKIEIRLCLAAYNPGEQTGVSFVPNGEGEYGQGIVPPTYTRNLDGWRDVWNFVDLCLSKLESTNIIAGLRIVKEDGIKYGPFKEEGAIWDYYPYWHSWITFSLECGIVSNISHHNELL